MSLSRTSELDAVNTILSTVGEPPVNALDSQNGADAVVAHNMLKEASREIQAMGWHFNTVRDVVLVPDTADGNRIRLQDSVFRVDLEPQNTGSYDIVQRGNYLYDRKGQTDAFPGASIKAVIVYALEWDQLPEPARRLITTRAGRIFQARMVGSGDHYSFTMRDEMNAMTLLKEFEGETADHSIFQNYDVYRVIDRGSVANRVSR